MMEFDERMNETSPEAPAARTPLAVAALIFSIFFFLFPAGIIGAILGIVALVQISRSGGRLRGRRMAVAAILLGLLGTVLFCVVMIFVTAVGAAFGIGRTAASVACEENLLDVGAGIAAYVRQNDGTMPPTLETLVSTGYLSSDDLACPAGSLRRTMEGRSPRGTDFHYAPVFELAELPAPWATPVAWEKALMHEGRGVFALYADGHVDRVSAQVLSRQVEAARTHYVRIPPAPGADAPS